MKTSVGSSAKAVRSLNGQGHISLARQATALVVPYKISRCQNLEGESQSLAVRTFSGILPPVLVAE